MEKHEGCLRLPPSFPDSWPNAELTLPDTEARYCRRGRTTTYVTRTREPLKRRVSWNLPPCVVHAVRVDGRPAPFSLEPLVAATRLVCETPEACETVLSFDTEPIEYSIEHASSIAEGDVLDVHVSGCSILGLDDRCGVIAAVEELSKGSLRAVIRDGLLQPYRGYGRLGMMNFARRTFFLSCEHGGTRFWHPIDLAILPPYEATQVGGMSVEAGGGRLSLKVRNNCFSVLKGRVVLQLCGHPIPCPIEIDARSESILSLDIPVEVCHSMTLGDNEARLVLPGGKALRILVEARDRGTDEDAGRPRHQQVLEVELTSRDMIPDSEWKSLRRCYIFDHTPYASTPQPLGTFCAETIDVPELDIGFRNPSRRFVPVSWKSGRPVYRLGLEGKSCRKLYLLLLSFLDCHDMFSPVASLTITRKDGEMLTKTLHFPGDLDSFFPEEVVGMRATARGDARVRHGLLPLLAPSEGDWPTGKPRGEAGFPAPEDWASCRIVKSPSSVMNVIELSLPERAELDSLTFTALGTEPAFGIVGLSLEL